MRAPRPTALASRLFIFTTLTASISTQTPGGGLRFDGDSRSDFLGYVVDGAGDVNGDGYDDVIVGSHGEGRNGVLAGAAFVYSGGNGNLLYRIDGDGPGETLGRAVSGAGDVNGDGCWDFIIGIPADPFVASSDPISTGRAIVISGMDGSVLHAFAGDSINDSFGYSVSGAGDVNGDGCHDLIVGAVEDDDNGPESGSARILSGMDGSTLYTFRGETAGSLFGWSVSDAGDVDADGFGDVAVGIPGAQSTRGEVRVYSGRTGATIHTLTGFSIGDQLGISVASTGDVNGDGFDDFAAGSIGDDGNGPNAGAARVFSGLDGTLLYAFLGEAASDNCGLSVDGAGDINDDGCHDVIVGSPGDSSNGPGSGKARIFSGMDGSLMLELSGFATGDNFGWSVASAGDVDGDGKYDIAVGAPGVDRADTDSGSAYVFEDVLRFPAIERLYGGGCIGSDGRLPRIGYRGHGTIGTRITFTLRGAIPDAQIAGLMVGHATNFPLDALGAPGCTLYTNPFATVNLSTDPFGMTEAGVDIANDPGLVGVILDFQWVILDVGLQRALPVSFSNALKLTYGN